MRSWKTVLACSVLLFAAAAWPWNQHWCKITLAPNTIVLGEKAMLTCEGSPGYATLSDGTGEPKEITLPYSTEVSPAETTTYTLIVQGQGRRWRDRWAVQDSGTLAVTKPLSKWSVSYPASTQKVKAVTADDAIVASVRPAPEVKPVDVQVMPIQARGTPTQRMLGLKPTPPGRLQAALKIGEPIMAKLRALPQPPENYDGSGGFRAFGMYGNDVYGTCVTAEEAAAKSVISAKTGAPQIIIPDRNVIDYCRKYGGLNGAYLDEVLEKMTKHGLIDAGGIERKNDPTAVAIDGTNKLVVQLAIYYTGMLKVAIGSSQVMRADDGRYGWTLLNARRDRSADHCVGYCGYGSLEFCCQTLGVSVPTGADPKRFCLIMFTWSRLGIVSWESAQNITSEWWMRGTDPDRLDAADWRVRYEKAMADIIGGDVVPADAVEWTVSYPAQQAVTIGATDAADAVKRVPYTGKPTATSEAARRKSVRAIIEVPVSVDVAPGNCPGGVCPTCPGGNSGVRRRR